MEDATCVNCISSVQNANNAKIFVLPDAFFLRYYASFESHLKFICERFAEKSSQSSRLSDISVDNFLSK